MVGVFSDSGAVRSITSMVPTLILASRSLSTDTDCLPFGDFAAKFALAPVDRIRHGSTIAPILLSERRTARWQRQRRPEEPRTRWYLERTDGEVLGSAAHR